MKRTIISLILILTMIIGQAAPALAATPGKVLIEDGNHTEAYLIVNGQARIMHYASYKYTTALGEEREIPAFCVHPTLHGVSSAGNYYVTAEELYSDPKVNGILAHGYPHQQLSSLGLADKYEGYYATKVAIWCYLNGWDINTARANPSWPDQAAAARVLNAAQYAYKNGITWTKTQKPELKAVPMTAKAVVDSVDPSCYSQTFKVTSATYPDGLKFDVQFKAINEAPAGTKIVDPYTNQEKSSFPFQTLPGIFEGQFKVLYPKESIEGETGAVSFELHAYPKVYEAFYGKNPVDAEGNPVTYNGQPVQQYLLDTDPNADVYAQATSTFAPGTTKEGDCGLRILKKEDGKNIYLPGAVFEVKEVNGKTIGTFTTNDDGEIFVPLDDFRTLEVTEVSAPSSYFISEQPKQIVYIEREKISTVTFENKPYGDLIIEKIDGGSGSPLPGAVFNVRGISSGFTTSVTTEMGGHAILNGLEPGGYEITEERAPTGYLLNTQKHIVNVKHGETATVTVKNTVKPSLKIVKVDGETKLPLDETVFEVYRDTTLIGEYMTNQLGEITLHDLQPGTYFVRETQAKSGYVINTVPQQIEVSEGMAELIFMNSVKPGLLIQKIDSGTWLPLPNVKFRIEEIGGTFVQERITGIDGYIDISDLDPASYEITETETPPGYLINQARRVIKLEEGQTNAAFVFTNTPKPSISIIKYDPNKGEPLPGASFRITKIEDGSNYLDRVTGEDGRIQIDHLDPGVYSVKETSPPSGYVLNDTEHHVELFPGKTSQLVVNNDEKPNLLIVKTDAVTGEPIEGATFTVNKVDSSTLTTVTTDENGEAFLKHLDPGVYTVKEQSVPFNYLLDETPQNITLVPNKTGTVQFQNYPKPSLTVNKIDSVTGDPIKGAKFHVSYASNDTFTGEIRDLGTYYTDENGQITLTKLSDGWYRIKELEPAAGYAIKAPDTQDAYITAGTVKSVTFENTPLSGIVIKKVDANTGEHLQGAKFSLKYLSGTSGTGGTIIGEHVTSANGTAIITGLKAGTYVIEEIAPPSGYEITEAAKTVYITGNEQATITVEFADKPIGGVTIFKLDEETRQAIPGAEFEVRKMNGELVGNYRTDDGGRINIHDLADGWYTVTETKAASGYKIDSEPKKVEVRGGNSEQLTVTNRKGSSFLIHKIDSVSGEGIYGVTFLISDSNNNPIATVTSDQNGYAHVPGLTDGKYYAREIEPAKGYIADTAIKTFYVQYGATSGITWKNTSVQGQIQVIKKSEDANPVNGFPAGTLLPGATFEIYDKAGNLVDTIVTDKNGLAASKALPLGIYTVKETVAPAYYSVNDNAASVEIEFSGQTVRVEAFNKSVYANVSIQKRGYSEVMPGQTIRYELKNIANNSTVPLGSFYWRDTLPTGSVRLDKIITGTWNARLSYKAVYKTNLSGDYRTLADNLQTSRNYALDASAAALGLASNEYVTQFMFVFGQVPAGFSQVETPYIYCYVLAGLPHEHRFANQADAGGLSGNQWVMANDRWVTVVFGKPMKLPRTGY